MTTAFRISRSVRAHLSPVTVAFILLALTFLALGCGGTSTTTSSTPPSDTTLPSAGGGSTTTGATTAGGLAGPNTVTISGFAFAPASIMVTLGDSVTWTNNDSVTHTVTADDNSFSSGDLAPGATYSFTFTKAGTFPYHCSIHPNMTASVVVQ
jgi:plastocyanin